MTIGSIESTRQPLKCANDIEIVPDISINELSTDDTFDAIIVPGGEKGTAAMAKSHPVGNLLQQHFAKGKLVAAICAGRYAKDDLLCARRCSLVRKARWCSKRTKLP